MSKKLPAFQFYPGDWMKDPNLSMCAPATRGIWMDLLCAMHENGRSGRVVGATEQLARLCRCTAADLASAIEELSTTKAAHVSERNGIVTVECRRMRRESQEREGTRVRVSRLRDKSSKNEGCNCLVTEMKRESNIASSSSSSTSVTERNKQSPKPPGEKTDDAKIVLDAYSAVKPPSLDQSRGRAKSHITKLLKTNSVADLLRAVENYRRVCEAGQTEERFRRGAGNFFGRDADFETYLAMTDDEVPIDQTDYGDYYLDPDFVEQIRAVAPETQETGEEMMARIRAGYANSPTDTEQECQLMPLESPRIDADASGGASHA